jgi:hypothetical protein
VGGRGEEKGKEKTGRIRGEKEKLEEKGKLTDEMYANGI